MALSAFAWGAVALFAASALALVMVLVKLRSVPQEPPAFAQGAPAEVEREGGS